MFLLRSILLALTLAALAVPVAAQSGAAPAAKSDKPAPTAAPAPSAASAAPAASAASADDAAIIAAQRPSYPLTTCVVSGDVLGKDEPAVEMVRDGRLIEFCCKDCVKDFDKSPASFEAKIDAAVIAAQKPSYPLKTCVVRGDKLVEGKAKDIVVGTRLIETCCSTCKKKALENPQTYLAKIDAALIEQQSADYPATTCVVSGEKLDSPVKFLYGTKLVEFCCKDCKAEFLKDPATYLAKLDTARAAHAGGAPSAPAPAAPASPAGAGHTQGG